MNKFSQKGEWVHVLYVCPCIYTWWWRLLCRNEWGASSSVIHPAAWTLKKLHAPHSSPKQWDWSEVGCLCLCVSLCMYAWSSVGWMGWSGVYNSGEAQKTAKESLSLFKCLKLKDLSGDHCRVFAHLSPITTLVQCMFKTCLLGKGWKLDPGVLLFAAFLRISLTNNFTLRVPLI